MESVGGREEHSSLPGVQRQMTGIDGGLMTPWSSGKVLKLVGHQMHDGVVVSALGAEAQRKVARYGPVFAQLLQIEVARVDFVEESIGVVEMTPNLVGQSRRVAGGAQVEEVAVFACADDVQFSNNKRANYWNYSSI